MKKAELRKKYIQLRKNLIPSEIEKRSAQIFRNSQLLNIWDKKNFHVFLTMKDKKEIDTSIFINHLWNTNKIISISKSNLKKNILSNYIYDINTEIKISNWGIPEPVNAKSINDKEIDVVFVPLLAFDKKGFRVGYGKGYYDNFLANCKPEVIKIGLSFFENDEIIEDIHNADIKLDYCISPTKTYNFNI